MKKQKFIKSLSATILTFSLGAPFAVSAEEGVNTVELEQENTLDQNTDNLLQENLFSYVHTMNDQLKLALSDNQVERASLLVDLSEKAIEAANKLFEDGNKVQASELLTKATEAIESAEELTSTEEEQDGELEEETELENPTTNEEIEVVALDDPPAEAEEVDEEAELDAKIGQNVISLAINYDKVQNPNAKAALKRNIVRSLKRLEAKYGDVSDLVERIKPFIELQEENQTEENTEVEVEEEAETEGTTTESEETVVEKEDSTDDEDTVAHKNKGKKKGHNKGKGNNGKAKGHHKH